jgi:succinate-semialdehyde dehydrogenase / glutarate-semialdehyde dehydrogenase
MSLNLTLIESYLTSSGLAVMNPATEALIAHVKTYDMVETNQVIAEAKAAQPAWAARTAKERAVILKTWFDLMLTHKQELAEICTAECGKPLVESLGEVAYAASFIEWFAEEGKRAYGDIIPTFAQGKRILTLKQPIGVAAAITPWNFPLAMIARKVAPALAAGCAMVVKPAEATPLSALAMEALAHQAGVPSALFRNLPSANPNETGKLFCADPRIGKLSFTGSTAVGKLLMSQSAATVKKVSMELGGNAPFIVFDDADLEAALAGVMVSKFRNAGQTCVCANRILVQDGVYDRFTQMLEAKMASLNVGNGADAGVNIGPLINRAAVEKVSGLVGSAQAAGAKTILGGHAHAAGARFYAPTLLTGIDAHMDISTKEIFGPVAAIQRFTKDEEAVALANDTPYGLAAYFYARDVGRIFRVMEGLEYGMVAVNDGVLSTETAPFGGWKESGIGREGSHLGLDEYLEVKYCLLSGL